jgi:hypothetical protein
MVRATSAVVCFLVMSAAAPVVSAQQEQSFRIPDNPFLTNLTIDRAGGVHLTKAFAIVFGGIKQGSSMAAGPALSHDFADGSFVQVKGGYSIRNFKLLQARYDSRPLFSNRAMVSTRLRWQDAPQLSLYPLGPGSLRARAEYGERKQEWSSFFRAGVAPHVTATAGGGLERYAIDAGFIDSGEDERLGIVPDAPGLSTRPWFFHSFVSAVFDTRLSPEYSRTGTALLVAAHSYRDLHDGAASFHGLEIAAAHMFPTVAVKGGGGPPNWKGALELSARTWLTASGDDSTVPFFLMPTLGGGEFLRGYPSYRFRDRDALLLVAEYRWAVHAMIDVAARYEAGAVAATSRGLGWNAMAHSAGGGIRVHSTSAALMRVDLARGREGLQLTIGFNLAGG